MPSSTDNFTIRILRTVQSVQGRTQLRSASAGCNHLPGVQTSSSQPSSALYQHHVLQQFLPDLNGHSYSLRSRRHNFTSPWPQKLTNVTLLQDNCLQTFIELLQCSFTMYLFTVFYCVLCSPCILSYVLANCTVQ